MTESDEYIENAAAYIYGMKLGRDDVRSSSHLVWKHLPDAYKGSYRHRAKTVQALLNGDCSGHEIIY